MNTIQDIKYGKNKLIKLIIFKIKTQIVKIVFMCIKNFDLEKIFVL